MRAQGRLHAIGKLGTVALRLAQIKLRHLKRRIGLPVAEPHVTIGRHTYGVIPGQTVLRATADAPVRIGNFCSISAGVAIVAHADHPLGFPSTYPFRTLVFDGISSFGGLTNRDAITRGPITIGHDVWIGQSAIILSGVTIESGAVIGAGAVVSKDIAPYSVAAGNPARHIRYRFSEQTIAKLLALRWWDLSDTNLEALRDRFYSEDIDAFIAAVEREKSRQRT